MKMTLVSGVPVFLDTNVFLRYNIIETPEHRMVRTAVQRLVLASCTLWISRQVVREFAAVVTRPQTFMRPLTAVEAASLIRALLPSLQISDENSIVSDRLLTLMEWYSMGGKQVHDANIVATMLANGITHLLTLNVADFVRFSDLMTIVKLDELLT